jgi:FkbM family methyltransferase
MIDIGAMFVAHGIKPRGVIHVGAHHGAELEGYLQMGFERVLFIEANPALIPRLKEKADAYSGKVFVANAAAMDADGLVMLNLASMDQSSSVLALYRHKEIYPTIKEAGQVEVPARRLDTLLVEIGLNPADFNFLNIDVQGAELMVLRGAVQLLGNIQAINTEINLAELYRGGALLGELESFLASSGFNRAAMVTPYHPTWGDAFYVRKPVVTMSTLGRNGRFANQLFQYMFLRLVAKTQGAVVQTPQWVGQELFGFDDPVPVLSLPQWVDPVLLNQGLGNLASPPGWVDFFRKHNPSFQSTDFVGYFMEHSSCLAPEKDYIRSLFRFSSKFEEFFNGRVQALKSQRQKILAIHLRRGDYGTDCFFRAPCAWYEKWIKENSLNPEEWLVYICSESPEPYLSRFPGYLVASAGSLGVDANMASYLDFYIMTKADYVLTANSSYSFIATMLNESATGFACPNVDTASLEKFDPWNAPVLQRKKLTAEEHQRLINLD